MKIVRVALDVPLPKLFDYVCPPDIGAPIGARVVVPFGKRRLVAVVVETAEDTPIEPAKLKAIERVLEDAPALTEEWVELMRFLSGYYQRPLGETVISSLPPRLRSLKALPREDRVYWRASAKAPEATYGSGRRH